MSKESNMSATATKTTTSKEQFMSCTVSNISQVYLGKRNSCRCGCGGTYISTSYMANPRNQINDKLAEQRLKKAKALIEQGADVDFGPNYVDVQTGENRTLTFYFDEIKK